MIYVVSLNSTLLGGIPSGQFVSDFPLKVKEIDLSFACFVHLNSRLPRSIEVVCEVGSFES